MSVKEKTIVIQLKKDINRDHFQMSCQNQVTCEVTSQSDMNGKKQKETANLTISASLTFFRGKRTTAHEKILMKSNIFHFVSLLRI